ncbi:MAG: sodium:solute symporter family protein [Bdellovibrionales bacterium]|nr:sodium:solute symporter family protein [Bdellovibrionales bacterium]
MTVTKISLILIILYLILIKLIGYYAHKKSFETSEDYFVVNRSLGTWVLVGTVIATMVNTLAVSGVPALVYRGGVIFLQMFVIGIIAPFLIYYYGPKIRKYGSANNLMTQAEIFGHFYNSKTLHYIVAILGLLAAFPFMAIQISAVGKVFSSATGGMLNYETAVAICSVSVGIYLYFGGSRAVVWTDMLQGICFFIIIIASAILFWNWAGGFIFALEKIQKFSPTHMTFHEKNTPAFIDNILSWPFAFFLWPQLFQRMYMAKSDKIIKQSAKLTFVFFNIIAACTFTMGIMGTSVFFGQLADPDSLVAKMFATYLPLGGAFIVLAVFATGMSTIDSILLTTSSIITRDLLKNFKKTRHSSVQEFNLARIISIILLIVVTFFALSESGRGAIVPLVTLGASIAALFIWPLIGMFNIKSNNPLPVIAAIAVGFCVIIISSLFGYHAPSGIGSASLAFLVAGITYFLFWLTSKNLL